jgi:hypothetical protein
MNQDEDAVRESRVASARQRSDVGANWQPEPDRRAPAFAADVHHAVKQRRQQRAGLPSSSTASIAAQAEDHR